MDKKQNNIERATLAWGIKKLVFIKHRKQNISRY